MNKKYEKNSEQLAEELNDQAYKNKKEAELKESQDLLVRLKEVKQYLPEEKYIYCQYHLLGSMIDIEEALVTGAFFETIQEEKVVKESIERGKEVRRRIEEIYPSFSKKYEEDQKKRTPKDQYGFGLIKDLISTSKLAQTEESKGNEGKKLDQSGQEVGED